MKRTRRPNWIEPSDDAPPASIQALGPRTWDDLHKICAEYIRDWERAPEEARIAYAFPNPEDRR